MAVCSPTFTTSAVVYIPVRSWGVDNPWAWAAEINCDLPHRQCAVPEGEILLPVAAHDLHGVLATGLLWPVRPGDQEPGAGVLLWGADERAEGGGAVAECGDTNLRWTGAEPSDQRPSLLPS